MSLSDETPFEGTIRENLVFGNPNIKDDEIYEVLDKVGLIEFLKEQPNGLDTFINPEGKQMSYTIAKKIILARAIIKKPKVLILEDPLDQFNKEEADRIVHYITSEEHKWALIVVSNNMSWQLDCNQVITLEKGKIISK
jgi:ABC-type multidrug transport system fused ATPase/permease subunit